MKNQQGFTIVELMISIAIAAGMAYLISEIFLQTNKHFSMNILKQERLITEKTIENYIMSNDSIQISSQILENEKLRACLEGAATSTCSSMCCEAKETEFYLLDPLANPSSPSKDNSLAGTQEEPVLYDNSGLPGCQGNCRYKMIAKFHPICYGDLPKCDKAAFIKVTLSSESLRSPPEFKPRNTAVTYYVKNNLKPFIETSFADLIMTPLTPRRELEVQASTGSSTEFQQLFYESCESSNKAAVKVTCYGFKNNYSKIYIESQMQGEATITLKINDGQDANASSDEVKFKVTVVPP